MNVLALNPRSSSLRFAVVSCDSASIGSRTCLGRGRIAPIGGEAILHARPENGASGGRPVAAHDHAEAVKRALEWAVERSLSFAAVGVRVVQVGDSTEAAQVEAALLARMREQASLAPVHAAGEAAIIERVRSEHPHLPLVAVSDSFFHADMPQVAREYAVPREWSEQYGIRRFGYHGLALRSVVEQCETLEPRATRIVVAHLGNGCSVTAIRDGRSVDTSMGFSPLEGLVMGTRSGSVDPAVVARLCAVLHEDPDAVVDRLNRDCGLLGVSGRTSDMRNIEALREQGNQAAGLAFDLFAYRARAYVASALAALEGCDEIVFSGGIGENSAAVRSAVMSGMEWCGVRLDPRRNADPRRSAGRISMDGSPVSVRVIAVDEESQVARAVRAEIALDR